MTPGLSGRRERDIAMAETQRELDCWRRKSAINKLAIEEGPARITEGS